MKNNIEYIKVFMKYESDDMPVLYFYEVDLEDERYCLRAIEIMINRQVKTMDDLYDNAIEITPIPTVDELNSMDWGVELHAIRITKDKFEEVWGNGSYSGNLCAD